MLFTYFNDFDDESFLLSQSSVSKIFLKTFDQSARGKTHIVEIKNTYTYFHTFERSIKEREGEGEDERSSRSDCW